MILCNTFQRAPIEHRFDFVQQPTRPAAQTHEDADNAGARVIINRGVQAHRILNTGSLNVTSIAPRYAFTHRATYQHETIDGLR